MSNVHLAKVAICCDFGLWTLDIGLFQAIRLVPAQRKILAQRMALPIVRQENSSQIRMIVKNNSEQVVGFALVPVCRAPYACDCRHMNVLLIEQYFQPKTVKLGRREQVIVDFKARLFFGAAIDATKIGKKVEFRLGSGFE